MSRDCRVGWLLFGLLLTLPIQRSVADEQPVFISEDLPTEALQTIEQRDWKRVGQQLYELALAHGSLEETGR